LEDWALGEKEAGEKTGGVSTVKRKSCFAEPSMGKGELRQ